jgi:hypothetical protein
MLDGFQLTKPIIEELTRLYFLIRKIEQLVNIKIRFMWGFDEVAVFLLISLEDFPWRFLLLRKDILALVTHFYLIYINATQR